MSNAPQAAEEAPDPRALRRADLAVSALLVATAIATFLASADFAGTKLATDVGPARFPRIYAAVLVLLALILAVKALRRPAPAVATPPSPMARQALLRVGAGIGICVVCFVAMQFLGFILGSVLQLMALMVLMGRRRPVQTALIAVALTAAVYLLFSLGLHVPLPAGRLFE